MRASALEAVRETLSNFDQRIGVRIVQSALTGPRQDHRRQCRCADNTALLRASLYEIKSCLLILAGKQAPP